MYRLEPPFLCGPQDKPTLRSLYGVLQYPIRVCRISSSMPVELTLIPIGAGEYTSSNSSGFNSSITSTGTYSSGNCNHISYDCRAEYPFSGRVRSFRNRSNAFWSSGDNCYLCSSGSSSGCYFPLNGGDCFVHISMAQGNRRDERKDVCRREV